MVLAAAVVLTGCPDNASDTTGNGDGNGDAPAMMIDTIAPDAVTNITATPLPSGTQVLLRWTNSSSDDVTTITISWSSTAAGIMGGSDTVEVDTQQSTIGNLVPVTPYTFTITVADAAENSTAATPAMVSTLNPIDADGDGLIDINALERLYNMRYNLDVGATGDDGRYKESTQMADGAGILCGTDAATACSGYELTRNLDFTDAGSYASGEVNNNWRPTGGNPATATNAGWEPIGSCNGDTGDNGILICGDNDDTPFAARFMGNSYTISNLYARNINDSAAADIGLFGAIGDAATIDTVGIIDTFVYGSGAGFEYIGALVGRSSGSISASYATGSTADGGAGIANLVGGLIGENTGSISASYTTGSTANSGAGINDNVGGLVGSSTGSIIASYASGSTANSGAGNGDRVGGLVGSSSGTTIASYAHNSTADGGAGNSDRVGGLVGFNNSDGIIIASYVSGDNSISDGGMGTTDRAGGLVGWNNGTIAASYASGGTANGGADNDDSVGGLVGGNHETSSAITASYATTVADGGSGSGDHVGSLVGRNTTTSGSTTITGTITASYGFGTTASVGTAGLSEGPGDSSAARERPTDDTVDSTSGPDGATLLLAPDPSDSTNTAVAAAWNQASSNTAGAWNFGTTAQPPALRYADYDGDDGDTYGCGSNSTATIVIPDSVPDGAGGTITVECGTTLLPGQGR